MRPSFDRRPGPPSPTTMSTCTATIQDDGRVPSIGRARRQILWRVGRRHAFDPTQEVLCPLSGSTAPKVAKPRHRRPRHTRRNVRESLSTEAHDDYADPGMANVTYSRITWERDFDRKQHGGSTRCSHVLCAAQSGPTARSNAQGTFPGGGLPRTLERIAEHAAELRCAATNLEQRLLTRRNGRWSL